MDTILHECFGNWLEAMILAFKAGARVDPADCPAEKALAFVTGAVRHAVMIWQVKDQQEWFETMEQMERVLTKLGVELGELADLSKTPEGRATLYQKAA